MAAAAAINENFEAGIIDEEEFLILQQIAPGEAEEDEDAVGNGPLHRMWDRFNFENWTDADCWTDVRFRKVDKERLCNVFDLEPDMLTYNRVRFTAVEGLCLLLRRLAFPCRYFDLQPKFGRPRAVLCVIFNHSLNL